MKQQTAVEFLINEISVILGPVETKTMQDILIVDAINKAKEVEKQQIIEAWIATDNKLQRIAAEKYYNETYGDDNGK